MKNMIKQTQGYGCGIYAVANALNIPNFITEERLEISKNGNNIGQLSKWLQEDGYEAYIEILYYNHLGKVLPRSVFNYHPSGVSFLPVLFNVQNTVNSKSHLVAGRIDKDMNLYLLDSLNDDVIITKVRYLNRLYKKVFGMFVFGQLYSDNYLFLDYI